MFKRSKNNTVSKEAASLYRYSSLSAQALDEAIRAGTESAEVTVARAETYLKFLEKAK